MLAKQTLVLLPGWGFQARIWMPVVEQLTGLYPQIQPILAELPALEHGVLDDWLSTLDRQLPQDAWLGGWSLGGMLATALAERRKTQCRGLITVAANARFVATPNWPHALTEETFQAFYQSCMSDPEATAKRFAALCTQGSSEGRRLAKHLQSHRILHSVEEALAGLRVLAQMDHRLVLNGLGMPQKHLFAAGDALVPVAAAADLAERLPLRETVSIHPSASHAVLLEQPEWIARQIGTLMSDTAYA